MNDDVMTIEEYAHENHKTVEEVRDVYENVYLTYGTDYKSNEAYYNT
jgi:hypothetical protein